MVSIQRLNGALAVTSKSKAQYETAKRKKGKSQKKKVTKEKDSGGESNKATHSPVTKDHPSAKE